MGQFDEIVTFLNDLAENQLLGFKCKEKESISFARNRQKQAGITITWTLPSDTYGSTLANNLSKVFYSIFGIFYNDVLRDGSISKQETYTTVTVALSGSPKPILSQAAENKQQLLIEASSTEIQNFDAIVAAMHNIKQLELLIPPPDRSARNLRRLYSFEIDKNELSKVTIELFGKNRIYALNKIRFFLLKLIDTNSEPDLTFMSAIKKSGDSASLTITITDKLNALLRSENWIDPPDEYSLLQESQNTSLLKPLHDELTTVRQHGIEHYFVDQIDHKFLSAMCCLEKFMLIIPPTTPNNNYAIPLKSFLDQYGRTVYSIDFAVQGYAAKSTIAIVLDFMKTQLAENEKFDFANGTITPDTSGYYHQTINLTPTLGKLLLSKKWHPNRSLYGLHETLTTQDNFFHQAGDFIAQKGLMDGLRLLEAVKRPDGDADFQQQQVMLSPKIKHPTKKRRGSYLMPPPRIEEVGVVDESLDTGPNFETQNIIPFELQPWITGPVGLITSENLETCCIAFLITSKKILAAGSQVNQLIEIFNHSNNFSIMFSDGDNKESCSIHELKESITDPEDPSLSYAIFELKESPDTDSFQPVKLVAIQQRTRIGVKLRIDGESPAHGALKGIGSTGLFHHNVKIPKELSGVPVRKNHSGEVIGVHIGTNGAKSGYYGLSTDRIAETSDIMARAINKKSSIKRSYTDPGADSGSRKRARKATRRY